MTATAVRTRPTIPAHRYEERPFDFGALEELLEHDGLRDLARRLDVVPHQVTRWREIGLTVRQADELACWIGAHPAEIWPDW